VVKEETMPTFNEIIVYLFQYQQHIYYFPGALNAKLYFFPEESSIIFWEDYRLYIVQENAEASLPLKHLEEIEFSSLGKKYGNFLNHRSKVK